MPQVRIAEGIPLLRAPREGEDIVADYAHTGLTLRRHPIALLRTQLDARGLLIRAACASCLPARPCARPGSSITRQRPAAREGVTFVTLEDEYGSINLIVWRDLGSASARHSSVHGSWGRRRAAARRRSDARGRAPDSST